MKLQFSHLEKVHRELNGVLVEDYEFKTIDVSNDERKDLNYQYYAMSNLRALGVDGQLKMCVVAADNFKIADFYETIVNQPSQVSAENNKA